MKKTPIPKKTAVKRFSIRNMRVDLIDRMKSAAHIGDTTAEDVCNRAVAAGIEEVEDECAEVRAAYIARQKALKAQRREGRA